MVTESVKNWYELGRYNYGLGIPEPVRKKINSNIEYDTEEKRKAALLLYYYKYVPTASWQNVAGALHRMEEVTALKAVNVFVQSTPVGELIFHRAETIYMFGKYL